jgi:hypothetical protein
LRRAKARRSDGIRTGAGAMASLVFGAYLQ